jgi:MFS family permease
MNETEIEEWAANGRVKATLVFAGALTIMAAAIISPALPGIRQAFADAPSAGLLTGLVLTLPALFIALGAPVVGTLIDRVGRLRVLAGATLLYAVAGAAPLVLDSLWTLLASRAVLGVAVAGIFVTSTALITDYYSGETQSAMLGIQGALATASGVLFLPAAGLLAGGGWRGPFGLYLVSLVLLPAVVFLLREPPRNEAATGTAGGGSDDSLPRATLAAVYGLALVGMLAFYTLPVQLPFYLAATTGGGAAASGAVLAVAMLAGGAVASQYRRIRARLGIYGTVAATFLAMGGGLVLLGAAGGLAGVVAGVAVVGGAQGSLVPNLNAWVAAVVPDATRGRALSGVVTGLFLGQFLSSLAAQGALARVGLGTMYAGAGVALLAVGTVAVLGRLRAGAGPEGESGVGAGAAEASAGPEPAAAED